MPGPSRPLPIDPQKAFRRLSEHYGGLHYEWEAVEEVVNDLSAAAGRRDGDDVLVLDALAALQLAREQLTYLERRLLQLGHEQVGLSMSQLARGLGVKSRQAAEQRYRRKVDQVTVGIAGDLSAGRAARRRRQAFDAWASDHRYELNQVTADLVAATWPAEAVEAGIDPLGFAAKLTEARIAQSWQLALSYAQAIATNIIAKPAAFDPAAVQLAETAIRLHEDAQTHVEHQTRGER